MKFLIFPVWPLNFFFAIFHYHCFSWRVFLIFLVGLFALVFFLSLTFFYVCFLLFTFWTPLFDLNFSISSCFFLNLSLWLFSGHFFVESFFYCHFLILSKTSWPATLLFYWSFFHSIHLVTLLLSYYTYHNTDTVNDMKLPWWTHFCHLTFWLTYLLTHLLTHLSLQMSGSLSAPLILRMQHWMSEKWGQRIRRWDDRSRRECYVKLHRRLQTESESLTLSRYWEWRRYDAIFDLRMKRSWRSLMRTRVIRWKIRVGYSRRCWTETCNDKHGRQNGLENTLCVWQGNWKRETFGSRKNWVRTESMIILLLTFWKNCSTYLSIISIVIWLVFWLVIMIVRKRVGYDVCVQTKSGHIFVKNLLYGRT